MIAARAVRMYAAVALPLAAVLATMPPALLSKMFPAQYGAMATLLKYTRREAWRGGMSLLTAFFQAADDYSCLRWLGAGLVGYVAALLAGWRIDGISRDGRRRGARRHGRAAPAGLPPRAPRGASAVPGGTPRSSKRWPSPWCWSCSGPIWCCGWRRRRWPGLRAVGRFLRPGARHARAPSGRAPKPLRIDEPVTGLAAHQRRVARNSAEASDAELSDALVLARLNRVEGCLARAYPHQLVHVLADLRAADDLFTRTSTRWPTASGMRASLPS